MDIDVELHYVGDQIRLVVPKQSDLSFEGALPALRELARTLAVDLDLPVTVEGDPERHLHTPDGLHAHQGQRAHQH